MTGSMAIQFYGHVTQGRYGAKLVEGAGYLMKLSRNAFVDYGPALALMGGRKSNQPQRSQEYMEYGIAKDGEEFKAAA